MGSIPWDDETVMVVNVNSTSSVSDTTLVAQAAHPATTNTSHFSNTFPRTSHAVNGSPRKYHLAPDVNGSNRSPSPSPKLHKKLAGLHSNSSKPGPIDNNALIVPNPQKVLTLTNEGGRLKRDVMLAHGKDFELIPEPVWRALLSWYGGAPALPRTVIPSTRGDPNPELELYPVMVRLLRHQTQTQRPAQNASFSSVVSGLGGMALSKWAASWQNQQNDYAPSEDSDQPGHPPSLIRVFAVCMKKAWVLSYPLGAQWRLWSDWTDAQADLCLHLAHKPFCWFCREAAQVCFTVKMRKFGHPPKHAVSMLNFEQFDFTTG